MKRIYSKWYMCCVTFLKDCYKSIANDGETKSDVFDFEKTNHFLSPHRKSLPCRTLTKDHMKIHRTLLETRTYRIL